MEKSRQNAHLKKIRPMPNSQTKILVVAAHPDDEVLGMGGTIRKLSNSGADITVIFLTDGVSSRDVKRESAESRRSTASRSLSILGCENVHFGQFPDNALDSIPQLQVNKWIENFVESIEPTTVFTHFINDLNVDHRVAAEATLVACRPKPNSTITALYHFEVLSSSEWRFGAPTFSPRYFIDVTTTFNSKLRALKEYEVEMEGPPSARSIEAIDALSVLRGSTMGMFRAEAFEVGFIKVSDKE